MSNPHVPIDPDLESAMVEARVDRWLDPDPLTPTELDHAYALGFEDGWDSTKPRPHRSRLELVVLVGAIAALVIVGQLRPADRRPASGDDRVLGRAHAAGDRDRAVSFIADGPAGPISLANGRSPIFLRVVMDPAGKVDVLDQLDDVAAPEETIHVYELEPGTDHGVALVRVQTRGHGTTCIPMASGTYRHRPDVVGEYVRTTEAWRAWVLGQVDEAAKRHG